MGGVVLLLLGVGELGVLVLDMTLKFGGTIESPSDSLLPAGVAEVLLHLVLDPFDPLVDTPLVTLEIVGPGEAEGAQPTLEWLLLEMDSGLVLGQIVSLAEAQAAGGTLHNISVTTTFTPN